MHSVHQKKICILFTKEKEGKKARRNKRVARYGDSNFKNQITNRDIFILSRGIPK